MSTPYFLTNIVDLEGWATAPGQDISKVIDFDLATFWNPSGAPNNHKFQTLADWGGTSYKINGIACWFDIGTQPRRIKVFTNIPSSGGVLLLNVRPTYDTVQFPGYAYCELDFADTLLTYLHVEPEKDDGNPFHFNALVPYYEIRPSWPLLIKRSPHGRGSFKFPGRQKPRWSSYQSTPLRPSDVV